MLAGSAVPDPAAFGVDAAFPAGLLALLLPGLRRRDARRVALTAAVVALLATPVLPPGCRCSRAAGAARRRHAARAPAAPGRRTPSREPPADEDEPPAASPGAGR